MFPVCFLWTSQFCYPGLSFVYIRSHISVIMPPVFLVHSCEVTLVSVFVYLSVFVSSLCFCSCIRFFPILFWWSFVSGALCSLSGCLRVPDFFFLNLSYFYNVLWTNETKVKMFDDNAQHHI